MRYDLGARIQAIGLGGPAFEMHAADDHDRDDDRSNQAEIDAIGAELTGQDRQRQFILGGRAVLTLQGASSRYTFKVSKKEPVEGSKYTQVAYFLHLLTGPDNTTDYTYMGMVDLASGQVRLTRASKYTQQSAPVAAWNWTMARVWRGAEIAPARIYHVGRCGRCGRALTVPSSIESGFGPECLGKLEGSE